MLDLDNILGIVLVMELSSRRFFDEFLFLVQNLLTVILALPEKFMKIHRKLL